MKTELQYLKDAFDVWCKSNGWNKGMPITAQICADVLAIADRMRAADRAKLEAEPTA